MSFDFSEVLEKTKFLFEWKEDAYSLEIFNLSPNKIYLKEPLPLPLKAAPVVTISVKLRQVWYEHKVLDTQWILTDGQATAIELLGPKETLDELKKNLEIGLCV